MVIKGSSRGGSLRDIRELASHLLNATDNETVEVVSVVGTVAADLRMALAEFHDLSLATRTRNAVYHTSLSVDRDEAALMTRNQWMAAAAELARHLGLDGQPFVAVLHRKRQREHLHVVWSRINAVTLKAISDSRTYPKHEAAARAIESIFGLRPVIGAHTRAAGTPRPVARATHKCWQAAERTKTPVASVEARIRAAWAESQTGKGFAVELERRRLRLASGRRGIVVLDVESGVPHGLPRRLGIRAAAVHAKLIDIDQTALPSVESFKKKEGKEMGRTNNKTETFGISFVGGGPKAGQVDWEEIEAWWRKEGFQPRREWNCVWVDDGGTTIRDYGDRIELSGGVPTDAQIDLMVQAAKDRGWKRIRFWGSPEFQQRGRLAAMKLGYDYVDIELECEDGKGFAAPPKPKPEPLPEHMRRALRIPDPVEPPHQPETPAPAPAPRAP